MVGTPPPSLTQLGILRTSLLQLQRTVGNRIVVQLLQQPRTTAAYPSVQRAVTRAADGYGDAPWKRFEGDQVAWKEDAVRQGCMASPAGSPLLLAIRLGASVQQCSRPGQ